MPTGYTSQLQGMKYDVKRWLKESLVRAMGVCVMFRDDGDLDEKQIVSRLKKDTKNTSHVKALVAAQKKLKGYEARSKEDWAAAHKTAYAKEDKSFKKWTAELANAKAKHEGARAELQRLLVVAPKDELIVNTLKFGVSQIELVLESEFTSYKDDILSLNVSRWTKKMIDSAKWDVDYHTTEQKESEEREYDRLGSYTKFVNFVDKNALEPVKV